MQAQELQSWNATLSCLSQSDSSLFLRYRHVNVCQVDRNSTQTQARELKHAECRLACTLWLKLSRMMVVASSGPSVSGLRILTAVAAVAGSTSHTASQSRFPPS